MKYINYNCQTTFLIHGFRTSYVCFEHLPFVYNITMATEAPGCSMTLRSNVTEAIVDGLCPETQYEITIISVAGEALSESTSL